MRFTTPIASLEIDVLAVVGMSVVGLLALVLLVVGALVYRLIYSMMFFALTRSVRWCTG